MIKNVSLKTLSNSYSVSIQALKSTVRLPAAPQIEKPPKRFFCLSRSNAGGEVYATAGVTPGSSSHLDKRLFQAPKSLSITYTGLSYPRDLMPNRITAKYTAVAA